MTARFDRFSGGPQNGRAFNHGVVASEGGTMHVTGQVAWTAKVGSSAKVAVRRSYANASVTSNAFLQPLEGRSKMSSH